VCGSYGDRRRKPAISEQQRANIATLAQDFPRIWENPNTPDRERKRLVRLLLEDVTLIKTEEITAHVRFKGGITKTLTLPRPLNSISLTVSIPTFRNRSLRGVRA
jgi:hypothetical protein